MIKLCESIERRAKRTSSCRELLRQRPVIKTTSEVKSALAVR